MNTTSLRYFGSTYGSGVYGGQTYACREGDTVCINAATSADNTNTTLANTGIAVLGVVTVACVIIFVVLLARLLGRKKPDNEQSE